MFELSADKIAFVILRAREYDFGTDGSGSRSAYELRDFIAGLTEDEQAELTAVMWIGRGTFDASDLAEAIDTARNEKTTPTEDYLLGEPQLADHLESGMEALGLTPGAEGDELLRM
ncbi:Protein of unknown function [Paracoccus solventivorans]|uniref:DUF3775 domain-containing protein n=1 Tax=Paracoccus solventivorans TaxID=53463 RepID=A0A1M7GMK8_9RHOB|nr:DUF3775 domain-containing protein [Paracoccus solventivorans]SHM17147.1 Protein of unknown function [Paracoccus solventivorans]